MQQNAHTLLAQMQQASKTYFTPEGLPGRQELDTLLAGNAFHPQDYAPMELFFIAETLPSQASHIPAASLANAYAAALLNLPGDWWGLPGSMHTATAQRFRQLEGAAAALRPLLDNTNAIDYLEGEERLLTKEYQWTRADLAATLLAAITQGTFDARASADQRKAQRAVLAAGKP